MAPNDPIHQQFVIAYKEVLKQVHTDIAAFAKRENQKILETDPRPITFTRWVDGNKGAEEETVKSDGVIVYEYNRYDMVAEWALIALRQRSPVDSGDYVKAHTLFLNGKEVSDLKGWVNGDEITITNYVPYSRKIEVGTIHGKKIKLSVSPHVYERTAQEARRLFKDIANIEFTYRGLTPGGAFYRASKKVDRPMRYPVIVITEPR